MVKLIFEYIWVAMLFIAIVFVFLWLCLIKPIVQFVKHKDFEDFKLWIYTWVIALCIASFTYFVYCHSI